MYEYEAIITRIVDGDTLDVLIDLGLQTHRKEKIRLYGINAYELNTPQGIKARERLLQLLPVGSIVIIKTIKDKKEKYGRYLGIITNSQGQEINPLMVNEGHAVPYLI